MQRDEINKYMKKCVKLVINKNLERDVYICQSFIGHNSYLTAHTVCVVNTKHIIFRRPSCKVPVIFALF